MITKNVSVSKVDDITLLEFGTGSIQMNFFLHDEMGNGISLKSKSAGPISIEGIDVEGIEFDTLKPDVLITFSKRESIEALIRHLEQFRDNYFQPAKQSAPKREKAIAENREQA